MDKQQIITVVKDAFVNSKLNSFAAIGAPDDKIWAQVECGFAAGDDPLFAFYKQDIGDFFWSPAEAFRKYYPEAQVSDGDLTVLSLVFASDDKTRSLQREQKRIPMFRWLYARNCWESVEQALCHEIMDELAKMGIRAITPDMHPDWAWQESPKYGLCCNWSQRHVAYTAGLGTFGLCDGLITRLGKAVRFTSLVLETKLPADKRPYSGHHDWCLYYAKGSCPSCMKACPVEAIHEDGHHKDRCWAYIQDFKASYREATALNADGPFGCGLCQGNVPCQKGVPKGLDNQ